MNPRVLVIDDDPDQLLMYKVAFAGEGFDVQTTDSGEEGLKLALENKPDAILLDIHMEDKSGLDVLRELKQSDKTKSIPVLIFTNFSKGQFEVTAKDLGAEMFIIKTEKLPGEIVKDVEGIIGRAPKSVPQPKKRSENVLLVEDNPYHREMYTTKFYLAGFSLITAVNGEKALEQVKKNKIDVILLDLALPGMNGIDVLKALKADDKTKDIPVITFTVTPKEDLPDEAHDYLMKNTVAYFEKMTQLPSEAVELVNKVLSKK